jgi:peptide chain release factor 2
MAEEKSVLNPHEIRTRFQALERGLGDLKEGLSIEAKSERLQEISQLEAEGSFWEDPDDAQKVQKEKKQLEDIVLSYRGLIQAIEDQLALLELAEEEDDQGVLKEVQSSISDIEKDYSDLENRKMLSEEQDASNAIITINSGAGGTESMDWAQMLYRMYIRYAESHSFKVKVLDLVAGEEAGLKSVTFLVEGPYSYGFLKAEVGVHRLVRISPFDSGARRHTSFASVFVSPEIDEDFEVEINDQDIRIDVFRSQGAGGQSVNTTDSAVRITHLPSNIVVSCQNERSQIKNKAMAMKILKSRLYEKHLEEEREKQAELEATKKNIDFGSQIRSYVLHPYKMVKDHRTDIENPNPERVLDGDLDEFIRAYLLS